MISSIEEKVHQWWEKNRDKVNPKFWWCIKTEFVSDALREINVTLSDYTEFWQEKMNDSWKPTGTN